VAVAPLALRGIRAERTGAAGRLTTAPVFGLAGEAAPCIGIKLIDAVVSAAGLA
jgi:high-affinity K+ transport system ATPase subunit B